MRILESIVLASASPRRLELLRSLGLSVRVVPSDADESARPGTSPHDLAGIHAAAKLEAVLRREPRSVVVAADTVVDLDGEALGKPHDPCQAGWMLRRLAGRTHLVHTAYVVADGLGGKRIGATCTTAVRFAPLGPATIDAYVHSGDPVDKAGAYGIQGAGAALVERIDGDFYTVMGFPLGDFARRLPCLDYRISFNGTVAVA